MADKEKDLQIEKDKADEKEDKVKEDDKVIETTGSMSMQTSRMSFGRVVDDEDSVSAKPIRWINIIFLPFNPVFQILILCCVIIKAVVGPLQAVYPFVFCNVKILDELEFIKVLYEYFVDPIYIIDTFLHIIHRQVADEAMKREHMPKSALFIIIDVICIIPLFRLVTSDQCIVRMWPNILAFSEFLLVFDYFALMITHSAAQIVIGYTIVLLMVLNSLICFALLCTHNGFCPHCSARIHDWRTLIQFRYPDLHEGFRLYLFGAHNVICYLTAALGEELKAFTYTETLFSVVFMILGHGLRIFIMIPKLFAEYLLVMRRIATYHPRVTRIIEETKRRNPSRTAYLEVENFYSITWKKRKGINSLPNIMEDLPKYMRTEIRQDLAWPVFFHSPTFRNTSISFKRYLSGFIQLQYKLPRERFFAGPHCYTNLYYIKSGIIQFISSDDSTSPVLSVTSGTLFGDISFYVPPMQRKVMVRCLTYCEILILTRADILIGLHKFPKDRREVTERARERMKHARTLHAYKKRVETTERPEHEGIIWIKERWWEINHVINQWKKKKKDTKCEIPPEKTAFHCAKFIGQLVLCTEVQLRRRSIFAHVNFPWILVPHSTFTSAWRRIVIVIVWLVLIFMPPNLTRKKAPSWFIIFSACVDFAYIFDLFVSISTCLERPEHKTAKFHEIALSRLKNKYFVLDMLAAPWIENLVDLFGRSEYKELCKFNRLLKSYMIFVGREDNWHPSSNPMKTVFRMIFLIQFTIVYVLGYFLYVLNKFIPELTIKFIFGTVVCSRDDPNCDQDKKGVMSILVSYAMEMTYTQNLPVTYTDLSASLFINLTVFFIMCCLKSKFIASLYLRHQVRFNYNLFVYNIRKHYQHYKIHPDLMTRVMRYLECHWKYYKGMDVLQPNALMDEPRDIYWKFHGAIAEKVIGNSRVFSGADSALIEELAQMAKYMILPKGSTLFLLGVQCKNVYWVVNGVIKCEYHDDAGELVSFFTDSHEMLSMSSVFLVSASLRTFVTATDCEMLYIDRKEFFDCYKRYSQEWTYIQSCIDEFSPLAFSIFHAYLKKYSDYQKKLRQRLFHARQSVVIIKVKTEGPIKKESETYTNYIGFLEGPEAPFLKYWLLFRMIVVIIAITSSSIQCASGAPINWYLELLDAVTDLIGLVDICLKLFVSIALPYFDERGIVITDIRMTAVHYVTRGLTMDLIAMMPFDEVLKVLFPDLDENSSQCIQMFTEYCHMYLLVGYFNYLTNAPTMSTVFLKILQWYIILLLLMLSCGAYFLSHCIEVEFNERGQLSGMKRLTKTCWLPQYFPLDDPPTLPQLHHVYAMAMHTVQATFSRVCIFDVFINYSSYFICVFVVGCGLLYWYQGCYCRALLVLYLRGNTVFQHGVQKLIYFLEDERVEKVHIDKAVNHFNYCWIRTLGLNLQNLMTERMGVVFRQDLNNFFYKRTFAAADILLKGGDLFQKALSNIVSPSYFLPNADMTREMDLMPWVHIVNRGRAVVTKDGKKLAILTKGSIFGQLDSPKLRPLRTSVRSLEHCDLIEIPLKVFHEILPEETKKAIAANPESANDYMAMPRVIPENPYNTVQYLLRGTKTIKLPFMHKWVTVENIIWYHCWVFLFLFFLVVPSMLKIVTPHKFMHNWVTVENNIWYRCWVYFIYMFATFLTVIITLNLCITPKHTFDLFTTVIILFLDFSYLLNFIMEYWTMELVVEGNKCVYKYIRLKRFAQFWFYIDILSITVPLGGFSQNLWKLKLMRLLRLHTLIDFYKYFCTNFQSTFAPVSLRVICVIIILHAIVCGWVIVACRCYEDMPFTFEEKPLPTKYNNTIDYTQWTLPSKRIGGCAKTVIFRTEQGPIPSFLVSIYWPIDYLIGLLFVLNIFTSNVMDTMMPLTITQTYYKLAMHLTLNLLDMWITSYCISLMYTKFRELYTHDYQIANLLCYLKNNGLSKALLLNLIKYERMLWQRQRGNWLPEMMYTAHLCLREEVFGSLYMHHLLTPNIFKELPEYFRRQMVVRLKRMVIFPGKYIVEEGDIYSCIYFIHEGEVEKWYTDSNGDMRLVSVLTQNGYFGMTAGLFPTVPFQFTYHTRTVVDLVVLRLEDWQDLLDGYPDIKNKLYEAAGSLKKGLTMGKQH